MPTIAKTHRYHELNLRLRKLVQLYTVMSELRLHTNKGLDIETSKYYHSKLYVWGDYGPFLTASLESMTQVFYIELDGYIGAYWDDKVQRVKPRRNEQGSLGVFLYDGRRTVRKKTAIGVFESLFQNYTKELQMIHELRIKLAHFKKFKERNKAFAPSDLQTREILNVLAEVLHLLGFQRWNKPHYIQYESDASVSTAAVVDKLVAEDDEKDEMRSKYKKAHDNWFKAGS